MSHQNMHAFMHRAADGSTPLYKRDDYSDNVHAFIHKAQHNTNSEKIKLNVPAGFANKAAADDSSSSASSTDGVAVEYVYVTASASFSGSTVAFVTDFPTTTSDNAANTQAAQIAAASVSSSNTYTSAITSSNAAPTIVGVPQAQSRTTAAAAPTADSDSTSNSSQAAGLSPAATAGLAIGIILAIALAAGLFFFCWKRKKQDKDEQYNEKSGLNEKRSSFFGAGSNGGSKRQSADSDKSFGTIHTTATAPRLSLRPVTQFLPAFSEKRKSSMQNPQMSEKSSAWERRPQNGDNPFSDPATQPHNPFDEGDGHSISSTGPDAQSPKSTQFGTAAAVPVSQMNTLRAPNNVHRVQLDFKPSMDDELELKSGQLVRLLHEYDDGWALCIRMDRSQQGVAPRTCLSKTAVKPRGPPSTGRVSPQASMRGPPQSPVYRKPVPGQAI